MTLNKLYTQFEQFGLRSNMKLSKFLLNIITEMLSLQHIQLGLLNADLKVAANYPKYSYRNYSITSKAHDYLNHPVHIINSDGTFSPSAFIPFCDFGGNMSVVGKKIDQFPVPVCDIFKKTTLGDQVCYSIDLNELDMKISKDTLEDGLNLFLDYNNEKQTNVLKNNNKDEQDLTRFYVEL